MIYIIDGLGDARSASETDALEAPTTCAVGFAPEALTDLGAQQIVSRTDA